MMSIQIIGHYAKKSDREGLVFNDLSEPASLDEFDISIIDLNEAGIWHYSRSEGNALDMDSDIVNLGKMIDKRNRSQVMICLPQDIEYQYGRKKDKSGHYAFGERKKLKNMLPVMISIIKPLFYGDLNLQLVYEETKTEVGSNKIKASFYFDENGQILDILTKSYKSEKATTVKIADSSQVGELYVTTLDITLLDGGDLLEYLKTISLIPKDITLPDWIYEVKMFDDVTQEEIITESRSVIAKYEDVIAKAKMKIAENLRYKSILHTNGDDLVSVVFEILEAIFNMDLSPFVDIKEEDFKIQINDVTFIGEIKGVTSNVKSEHISQLDVHCQSYIDGLQEHGKEEDVKGLLIINHQRNKRLYEREDIFEKQIKLAERNGSLIIETKTLLKLFEQYRCGDITTEECAKRFKEANGLLII